MLDAYTLRKAVPRLVFAAIVINISIYLCLAAVDITNVIGRGFAELISAPFVQANTYDFGIKGNVSNATALIGGVGIFAGAGGLGAMVGALASLATAPLATLGSLLILMIPIALAALGVMITIVVRQALIIFLVITAPIAIALFVLPGTEKYFRQWWNIFLRTLIVYPIIAVIFAMSDVFGAILFQSAVAGSGPSGVVKIITGVIVIYAPLFMIPFAFRLAGGVIAQVANVASTGAQRVSEFAPIKGRREHARRDLGNTMTQGRARVADRLKGFGNTQIDEHGNFTQGRFRRHVTNRALRGLSGAVGGYNIEAQASAGRAETSKIMNDQIATGRDEEIVGLATDKRRIDALRAQGIGEGTEWQRGDNGQLQYRSLNGTWVDEAHVSAGHARWGDDEYAQQAALSYAMRKADTTEKATRIKTGYESLATDQWGLSRDAAGGVLKGAGFENQGQHLQFKYMRADGSIDHDGMIQEIYESKGSYPLANMSSDNMEELVMAADSNSGISDTAREQLASVSETFMHDLSSGRGQVGEVDGQPLQDQLFDPGQPAAQGGQQRVFSSSGSGSVNEKARELAVRTGRYVEPPDQEQRWQRPDSSQK